MRAGVPWLLWRRRDAIGVAYAAVKSGLQAAAVALLPHSSNVSTHAQRTAADDKYTSQSLSDSTNAGYGVTTGRRIQQRRHQNQFTNRGFLSVNQLAALVQPRLGRKKAGIAAGNFELVCLFT